jgi:adenine-specific DNA-methyltransferase
MNRFWVEMSRKQRLELTWIGKDERPRLEPRILLEDTEKSYHAQHRVTDQDIFDNRLIFGDNLLALKALEQEFTGKVKCIFIDPPYNTGSAFEHYDDGVEHSIWLGLMRDRLEILRNLLAEDGSIWITIDDNEAHYLKVMCDEIFGRKNFVANVVWQKKYAPANDALWLSDSHDHVLVFAKNKSIWRPNKLARTSEQNKLYSNPDNDPRGPWMSDNYTCAKSSDERPNLYYAILNPNTGEEIWPKKTRVWAFDRSTHQKHIEEQKIYWGKDGKNNTPRLKKFLSDLRSQGRVSSTIWLYEEVGHTQDARREILFFNPDNPFSTPKPEKLIGRILELATNPSDLVLDSFAGSGTTGAVAQKMGRRWIMIELGEHCHTHIIPRLQKVINNEDPGGITKTINWQGGGGFRYFKLAPSLLEKDKYDNWVISPKYNPVMLAEAMCKLMGFTYAPSQTHYWNQGYSSESDHIYVTTNTLNYDQLNAINQELRDEQTLLICCKAFRANPDDFPKLTIKKIPQSVLHQCEWDHDDYSLNVANLKTLEKPPKPIQTQQLSLL